MARTAPRSRRREPLEVWKFGGASLASAEQIEKAAALIARHSGPLVVVPSALAGITDLLLEGARQAMTGNRAEIARLSATFLRRHRDVVRALLPSGTPRRKLLATIDIAAREYRELCAAVGLLDNLAPRASDRLVSRGERMSAQILTAALIQAGRRAVYIDAVDVVETDEHHGSAAPNLTETRRRARKLLLPRLAAGSVVVVPGFIGRAPDGSVTTMGRGGTDLSATLLARALNAKRVVLWKDVPGILTADPRLVPDARLIPQLHHREAGEVAHYGAKVLHPRALIPIAGTRVEMRVRSFLNPDAPGTEVSARRSLEAYPVKALAIVRDQAIVTVAGKGMAGVHGIAARTFSAVEAERLSVSTIFQASSESSIGFTLPESEADRAVKSIRQMFSGEITSGLIDNVTAKPGMAVLAVVGDGMAGTPGIAARVFSALATAKINVVAIAQGSSELNISVVVEARHVAEAQRRIHAAFQLSRIAGGGVIQPERMEIILLGFGQIGRSLAGMIGQVRRPALDLKVAAVIDRSGYVFDPQGLGPRRLAALVAHKKQGGRLADAPRGHAARAEDAIQHIATYALTRPVLVDLTADDTAPALEAALTHGMDLVLANKRPLAGRRGVSESLWQTARARGRRVLHEATVGAGLPIIDTYHKLTESGDRVERIEGLLSGTLGYVLSEVGGGTPFSRAVRGAMSLGYTEPDPREDLSGMDVGRKALILARLLGYPGELSRTAVESLVPKWARALPLADFLRRLPELDKAWRRRVEAAAATGMVLRYVATVTRSKIAVGLRSVPTASPLAAIKGSDNQLVFTTARYKANPLVITGPGAGAEVTAAGVLNDILRLAGA